MPAEVQISLYIGSFLVLASSQCPSVYMPASSCQAVIGVFWLNIFLPDLSNWPLGSVLLSTRARIPGVRGHLLSYM